MSEMDGVMGCSLDGWGYGLYLSRMGLLVVYRMGGV